MIRSFRNAALEKFWQSGKPLPHKMPAAETILRLMDLIEAAGSPRDVASFGFRFDEWVEQDVVRFGVMISDHWVLSYGWANGHAIELDLEWVY
jgi:toxin HigB-1